MVVHAQVGRGYQPRYGVSPEPHARIVVMSQAEKGQTQSEAALVAKFVDVLRAGRSPWNGGSVLQEFGYARGKTDIVITTEDMVIAVEAKLSDWRRAMDQAYRNTCYAQCSFVLLPSDRARHVMKFIGEFEERGVGLCCIEDGEVEILFAPAVQAPVEPWLTKHVRELANV